MIGLVERGGRTRLVHIQHATKEQVRDVVVRNVSRESALHTDESNLYAALGFKFEAHRAEALESALWGLGVWIEVALQGALA